MSRRCAVGLDVAPDLVVEGAHPQALPGGELAPAEALLERVVDLVDELDRLRVLQDALLGRQRPVIERPQRGLGNAGEHRDPC
jgi:hypothetical protein